MKLKDGRQCMSLPWMAQTKAPWREGYSRVFIPFTATEQRNAKAMPGGFKKQGHVQIVRNNKLA
jgi:hypothetical protein